ncbi:DUF763 domain-containing protein [Candidatus Marsarchaeota archaeon]|nr:DUF763 domain-containing protein [Candidatus Marsarchaeota archaeon]MCL5404764.1 DUF763 domain-containing protein [Candidatus Marsarchaeota archaeon]
MQSISILPLHNGRAPKWLFPRMVKLAKLISDSIISMYGERELINRLSNPYWFQALACAIGYDWHSSGTTTVTVGALKEALNYNSNIFIAGGKGKQGTSTPAQIAEGLEYFSSQSKIGEYSNYSRMLAKTDAALVYDDVSIYHHAFIFSKGGAWCVIQQAMHGASQNAIRFQASLDSVSSDDMTNEPNNAIVADFKKNSLDLTFHKNEPVKKLSVEAVNTDIRKVLNFSPLTFKLPKRHEILQGIDLTKRGRALLEYANGLQPQNYEELLGIKGIGRKTLRSLALISTLLYEEEVYYRDPILYAYNVGGKDGIPYEINLKEYDSVISSMREIVQSSDMSSSDSSNALLRLAREMESHYSIAGRKAAMQ